MSDSIQSMSSAGAGASKGVLLSKGSPEVNTETSGEPAEFTAVFAEFLQTDPSISDQTLDEGLAEILAALLPQEMLEDGKFLPEGDSTALWQAYLQIQPSANDISNKGGVALQLQAVNLFDGQRKPVAEPPVLSQAFLLTSGLNPEDQVNALTEGGTARNIAAQIAALQINPAAKDAILFNINENTTPVHATNSTLSNSLSALGFASGTHAASSQTQHAPLNLGQQAWESNLGSRLQMLVGQNSQQATIRLDPPELGSLDVKIKISNDIANVSFSSPHAHVRDALETAVPRLREMFTESGLSLGDVNVRQESFAQQQNQSGAEGKSSGQFMSFSQGDENSEVARKIVSNNLLDTYA